MRSGVSGDSSVVSSVVLAALVARPKENSVAMASQSTSATYATSLVTYKIHTDRFKQQAEVVKTMPSLPKECDEKEEDTDTTEEVSLSANSDIVQLLSEMKNSFEVELLSSNIHIHIIV
jgi:hypothetical protein